MAAQAFIYGGMAALQLAGGYFASQNIKESARINREIAEMNAEFAELDAYDAELEGYTRLGRYQSVIDNTLSEQQAIMTAQNIDVSYGSAATIQEETRFMGELNKMELEKQAQEAALGYTRQARDIRFGANLEQGRENSRAASTMFNSVLGAANTGLTGYKRSR